jgi:predicted RNA-binding protein YlqC (UPF0109 family)
LVDHPEQVEVTEKNRKPHHCFMPDVAEDDMGKIIGSRRIAKAIRTVLKAMSTKEKKQVVLKIRLTNFESQHHPEWDWCFLS